MEFVYCEMRKKDNILPSNAVSGADALKGPVDVGGLKTGRAEQQTPSLVYVGKCDELSRRFGNGFGFRIAAATLFHSFDDERRKRRRSWNTDPLLQDGVGGSQDAPNGEDGVDLLSGE